MHIWHDAMILGGLVAIGFGLYELSPPYAWIFGGLAASTAGYAAHRRGRSDAG